VHDGPDYLEHAALGRYLSVLAADGEAPPTRVLALTADPRDRLYGACDEYAQALVAAVLPRANEHAPTTAVVGLGASLGALAVLHAEWRHPGTFGAMLLQSGAFFTPATDPQERGFPAWDAVTGLVAEVGGGRPCGRPAADRGHLRRARGERCQQPAARAAAGGGRCRDDAQIG